MAFPPIPGINCDKLKEETPQRTSRGYATTELWECWYADSAGGPNYNGLVDPQTIIDNPGLPGMGASHGSLPGAIVIDKRVTQVVANWSVIVAVLYRGWGLYHGGPRATGVSYSSRVEIELPIWNRSTDGVVVGWLRKDGINVPRMVALRQETRFVGGNQQSVIEDAVAANSGTLWTINGNLYRLSDRCSAWYDGTSYTRTNYVFERECALPSVPAGSSWGNDNLIPALPALYVWSDRADSISSANPPVVSANPPLAVLGGPPAFPSLPGFP